MNAIESLSDEMNKAASEAQQHGGSVSWRMVRAWAVRLLHLDIEHAIITKGRLQYLQDHHQITSSAIGLAKMAIMRGNVTKAMEYLQKCSLDIDESIKNNLPAYHYVLQHSKCNHAEESPHLEPTRQ